MSNRCIALPLLAWMTFASFPVDARGQQGPDGVQITEPAMVADTAAAEAGKPFLVGFHFKIAKGWHTYWQFAGSPGFPLTVEWELPQGWHAGPLEFPLPESVTDEYGQTFFAYEHEVLFPVRITPPAQGAGNEVRLGARLKWQVCRETCIVGNANLELKLPVGPPKPANTGLFAKWLGRLPKTTFPPTDDVKFDAQGKQLIARAVGLPAEAKVELFPVPPESFGGTFELGKKLTSQTVEGGARVFTFPFEEKLPAGLQWRALLVMQMPGGPRDGWLVGAAAASTTPPPKPEETPAAGTLDSGGWDPFDDIRIHNNDGASIGLMALLLQGFLGGLLLNLMPCVLPVISLKIFGFVRQAGEARARIFHLGLAFCAGVFAFFAIIATLIVAFASAGKSFGWGAQFSNPLLLTAMLGIVFVFGLSMLGVFEFTLGGGATSKLSELSAKEGPFGAFLHGLFTTLLGTSCTAPLVGPVIGAAITRPGPQVYALFASIATGLALPYFLLTWQPAWMKFLPKPGTWMVRFKQTLGFVMLGLVVWLLDSFPTTAAIVFACAFLLVLGFGCWLMGSYHDSRWALPAALLLAAGGWYTFVHGRVTAAPAVAAVEAAGDGIAWEPFSTARIRQALEQKRPVFIDFTAKWCLNCKYFEATVINTAPVIAALKAKGVVTIKADYTREPPDIAAALKKTGRAGVPLYMIFRKRGDYWIADGLTQSGLLEQLNRL